MGNQDRTREQLVVENEGLRQRVAAMEEAELERSRREEDLRRSEAKWRSVAENAPLFVAIIDRSGDIQFLNRFQPGFDRPTVLGRPIYDFFAPQYHAIARECLEHVFLTRERASYECVGAGPDGGVSEYVTDIGPVIVDGEIVAAVLIARDITNRKLAEKMVQESERRFRSLFQDSSVGTVVVSLDGEFIQVNRAFRDFLGYSEQELIGRTVLSVTHPQDCAISSKVIYDAAHSGPRIQRLEKRYLHKSGRAVWGEVSSILICKADGTPDYFVTQVLDIAERKQAETDLHKRTEQLLEAHNELEERVEERTHELWIANEQLRREVEERRQAELALGQSHDELQAVYDSMVDGLLVTDIETLQFVRANASICRMLGYSEAELRSLSVRDIHPKEALTEVLEKIRSAEEIKQTPIGSIPVLRKDGSVFYAEIIGTFLNYRGRPCSMGIFRDITERRQAEEVIRQSHGELQAMYDQAVDGIMIADAEHLKIVRVNPAYCRMIGYSEEEAYDLSPERLHSAQVMPAVWNHLDLVKRGSVARVNNLQFLRKDGSIVYADVTSGPLHYNGRASCISFFHDVTERKHAEDALEQERQSLWRMLQASDHERQVISYEIHDGLAQYLAAAGMQFQSHDSLKEASPDEARITYETAVELVRQAHSESRRLISEVRPPVIDEIGLETAISHLVYEQRQRGGPKIEFTSNVQFGRLPPILENALYRIAQEALTNACKHSRSKKVTVTMTQEGQDVRLEVRDWGIGFDSDSVKKDRFGLEGIRQRVRLLGGRLTIDSKPNSGTLIQAVVPIVETHDGG